MRIRQESGIGSAFFFVSRVGSGQSEPGLKPLVWLPCKAVITIYVALIKVQTTSEQNMRSGKTMYEKLTNNITRVKDVLNMQLGLS